MYARLSGPLAFVLVSLFNVSLFADQLPAQADFYVSTTGRDSWSGRLAKPNADQTDGPFSTIERAQQAVHHAITQKQKAYTVLIRKGTYRLDQPLTFTPEDSGRKDAPITYAAYPGESPVISGARTIKGWEKTDNGLWKTTIKDVADSKWFFHQLFINGQRRTRARTPNQDYYHIKGYLPEIESPRKDKDKKVPRLGFEYKPGQIKRWHNLDDVNIFVYHSWTSSMHWIKSLNEEENLVRFTAPSNWPIGYWDSKVRFYVTHCKEALDQPGEWYLDRHSGELFYYPHENENLAQATTEAPTLRKLLVFNGDFANAKFVEHLRFKGLSFQYSKWHIPNRGIADGQAGAAFLQAPIYGEGVRHCEFNDCEIAHSGEYGLFLQQGCQHNRIVHCHIHDLAGGGIRIGGMGVPKNDNDASFGNVIDNNFVHDGGHVWDAGVGVWIGLSRQNKITHNEICDFDYTGISIGWSWGYKTDAARENTVEYNHVYNIGRNVLSDMGGIYTLGLQPGTVIRHNIFHHIYSRNYGGWGLYTDEGSTGILMEKNLVYKTKTGGFHQHYGKDNIIRNNILAFAQQAQLQKTRNQDHLSFKFLNNIIYFDNCWLLHGRWDTDDFQMDRNLYWDTSTPQILFNGLTFEQWQAKNLDKHSKLADPQFVDAENFNFHLQPDSPALKMGFEPFDYEKAGLYGDDKWVNLPDKIRPAGYVFPPPPQPEPFHQSFEETKPGEKPVGLHIHEEKDATIRVSEEIAATGKHSLKITDQAGLSKNYIPLFIYNTNYRKGLARSSFHIYRKSGAMFYHQWRDGGHPYRVGPSLRFEADGRFIASGKKLIDLPDEKWIRCEIQCPLGAENKTYDLTITIEDQKPQFFKDIPFASPNFFQLKWFGFVADEQKHCVYYIDDIDLELIPEESK